MVAARVGGAAHELAARGHRNRGANRTLDGGVPGTSAGVGGIQAPAGRVGATAGEPGAASPATTGASRTPARNRGADDGGHGVLHAGADGRGASRLCGAAGGGGATD